ncbi:ABC transporter ATP-binding protein [Acidithrix ferrooxidans]|uniref:Fatty acid ABC transporter ATP-binding/permease protein n=2 Tax=root TaxID=1 RepID=A0A0D8HLF8_9ACTN|nr:ABC transporter ATP-binding protein [Acidithrix ferrooxidans]KJF18704.1 putative ABC transporter ATP-binding protein [Acidithrix ferrooxidans]
MMRGGPQNARLPIGKSKNTKATAKAMVKRFNPEAHFLIAALIIGSFAVAFSVVGPKLLGDSINVIFNGIVASNSKVKALMSLCHQNQACVTHYLVTHGQAHLASMLSGMALSSNGGVNFHQLLTLSGETAGAYVLGSVLSWMQGFIMAGVAQRTVKTMRSDVENKLAKLPLSYFDTHPHGDILSRVTNDIDNISTVIQQGLSQLLTSILTIIGVLVMMFWISPILAVVSLITVPLAIFGAGQIAKRSQKQFTSQWKETGALNGHVEEMHTGHNLVRTFGRSKASMNTFNSMNERMYIASFKAQFLSGIIQPMMQFFSNLNYVTIAVIGGYRVATGAMSFGNVVAFTQYARQFTQPMTQIASQMNLLQSGLASAERVFELLDAPQEVELKDLTTLNSTIAGHIKMDNVSFCYAADKPLIDSFSLEVLPGQTVAIVGPTGAGKTTIVNLLMRFYEINSGSITLDGMDYSSLSRESVRSSFGMVLQDTWLFGGTIWENIAYGRQGASHQEIEEAAKAAFADRFIRTLNHGYDTHLDGEASGLSEGQKQLLTIARAFLAKPTVLILDEATSSVDSRTEVLIQDAMARLRQGRTSFVIAHRLSTIRNADIILVMESGRIVEKGHHEELIALRGAYFRLYNSQFTEASVVDI